MKGINSLMHHFCNTVGMNNYSRNNQNAYMCNKCNIQTPEVAHFFDKKGQKCHNIALHMKHCGATEMPWPTNRIL